MKLFSLSILSCILFLLIKTSTCASVKRLKRTTVIDTSGAGESYGGTTSDSESLSMSENSEASDKADVTSQGKGTGAKDTNANTNAMTRITENGKVEEAKGTAVIASYGSQDSLSAANTISMIAKQIESKTKSSFQGSGTGTGETYTSGLIDAEHKEGTIVRGITGLGGAQANGNAGSQSGSMGEVEAGQHFDEGRGSIVSESAGGGTSKGTAGSYAILQNITSALGPLARVMLAKSDVVGTEEKGTGSISAGSKSAADSDPAIGVQSLFTGKASGDKDANTELTGKSLVQTDKEIIAINTGGETGGVDGTGLQDLAGASKINDTHMNAAGRHQANVKSADPFLTVMSHVKEKGETNPKGAAVYGAGQITAQGDKNSEIMSETQSNRYGNGKMDNFVSSEGIAYRTGDRTPSSVESQAQSLSSVADNAKSLAAAGGVGDATGQNSKVRFDQMTQVGDSNLVAGGGVESHATDPNNSRSNTKATSLTTQDGLELKEVVAQGGAIADASKSTKVESNSRADRINNEPGRATNLHHAKAEGTGKSTASVQSTSRTSD